MASDLNKPNGQAVITPPKRPAFVEALPVKRLHGVGPATVERVKKHGIETGADLKSKSLEFLTEHFGKSGPCFYGIAHGIDEWQPRLSGESREAAPGVDARSSCEFRKLCVMHRDA